jgi:hypothetical protein
VLTQYKCKLLCLTSWKICNDFISLISDNSIFPIF